ncbi:MAG: DUF3291 domain-containing protein [Gammaproteobacteria bacterium]
MFHLAQINIAKMLAPLEYPLMADFVARLDSINALADRSPGFVWRLQDEVGDATSIRVFEDDRILINMSVWESIEALSDYVYQSGHVSVLRDRKRWFTKVEGPSLALWWVRAGSTPEVDDAVRRLALLKVRGASVQAFTFAQPFSQPDPDAALSLGAE